MIGFRSRSKKSPAGIAHPRAILGVVRRTWGGTKQTPSA